MPWDFLEKYFQPKYLVHTVFIALLALVAVINFPPNTINLVIWELGPNPGNFDAAYLTISNLKLNQGLVNRNLGPDHSFTNQLKKIFCAINKNSENSSDTWNLFEVSQPHSVRFKCISMNDLGCEFVPSEKHHSSPVPSVKDENTAIPSEKEQKTPVEEFFTEAVKSKDVYSEPPSVKDHISL